MNVIHLLFDGQIEDILKIHSWNILQHLYEMTSWKAHDPVVFLLEMDAIMGERTDKIEKHSVKKSASALQNIKKNKGLELKKIKAI